MAETHTHSLGLSDKQRVIEEEEVSVLGLQARLQLCLGVTQEQASRAFSQEGLDQGAGLWADWYQAAFPGGQRQGEHQYDIYGMEGTTLLDIERVKK